MSAKLFDRDSCGGLIVHGLVGSDGTNLTCQRCWPSMVTVKRCNTCLDRLEGDRYFTDALGDPYCAECKHFLMMASARRRRP